MCYRYLQWPWSVWSNTGWFPLPLDFSGSVMHLTKIQWDKYEWGGLILPLVLSCNNILVCISWFLGAKAEAIAPANKDLGLFSCFAPDILILGLNFSWGAFLNLVLSAQTPQFCLLHSEVLVTKDKEERKGSTVCCGFHSAPFPFPDECNNFHCHFVSKTEICSIKHAMLKCCLGYELRELEPLLVSTASFTSHRHGEMKVTEEEHLNQHKPNWQW